MNFKSPRTPPVAPAALAALAQLISRAHSLDVLSAHSLSRSYGVPVERVAKMLDDAKRARARAK